MPGQGLAVLAVAAADHPEHRDVAAQAMAHHLFVAGGDALVGQLQVTQGIVLVHIHPGVVQHQVRLVQRQQVIEGIVDHLQVVGVAHAHRQGDVPVAAGLARREVFFAVQRDSHGIRGMFENPRGAVALVHVAVEDQHPADPSGFQQVMADHRQVVEDAVSMTIFFDVNLFSKWLIKTVGYRYFLRKMNL